MSPAPLPSDRRRSSVLGIALVAVLWLLSRGRPRRRPERPAAPPPAAPPPAHPRLRRAAIAIGLVLLGAAAGIGAVVAQPPVMGHAGPVRVTLDPSLSTDPGTVLDLGPGGSLSARTHDGPARVVARLEHLEVQETVLLADEATRSARTPGEAVAALTRPIADDLDSLLDTFATRSLLVAAGAGLVAGLVLPRRRLRWVALTTGSAVAGVVALGAVTWSSYDTDAFGEPEFAGPVAELPALVDTVSAHVADLDAAEGRLEALSRRVAALYEDLAPLDRSPDETVVLFVSDLHSNPVGIELIEQVGRDFDVDAVVDTGDLTSFGIAAVEARVIDETARIADDLEVPYYLVPGNHDSLPLREHAAAAGLTVLEREVVEIEGISLLGMGDPDFTPVGAELVDEARPEEIRRQASRLSLATRVEDPDLVAAHDPAVLEQTAGLAPVLLSGHLHRPKVSYVDGSVHVEAGTAGAHGLDALSSEDEFHYQLQLLRFVGDELAAVDLLKFRGTDGAFSFERVLVDRSRVDAYEDVEIDPGPLARLADLGGRDPGPG